MLSAAIASDKLDVIVIDPGHGGKDPGTIGISGSMEKDINLAIAQKLSELLRENYPSIKIILMRTTDSYVEVKERTILANSLKAKLFISIHCNHKKEDESDKNGFELYVLNRDRLGEAIDITMSENALLPSKASGDENSRFIFSALAQNAYLKYSQKLVAGIELNIINSTELVSRGVLQSGFWVLVGASMPSVLVECGYLSDKKDESYLMTDVGKTNISRALFDGFARFKLLYESR